MRPHSPSSFAIPQPTTGAQSLTEDLGSASDAARVIQHLWQRYRAALRVSPAATAAATTAATVRPLQQEATHYASRRRGGSSVVGGENAEESHAREAARRIQHRWRRFHAAVASALESGQGNRTNIRHYRLGDHKDDNEGGDAHRVEMGTDGIVPAASASASRPQSASRQLETTVPSCSRAVTPMASAVRVSTPAAACASLIGDATVRGVAHFPGNLPAMTAGGGAPARGGGGGGGGVAGVASPRPDDVMEAQTRRASRAPITGHSPRGVPVSTMATSSADAPTSAPGGPTLPRAVSHSALFASRIQRAWRRYRQAIVDYETESAWSHQDDVAGGPGGAILGSVVDSDLWSLHTLWSASHGPTTTTLPSYSRTPRGSQRLGARHRPPQSATTGVDGDASLDLVGSGWSAGEGPDEIPDATHGHETQDASRAAASSEDEADLGGFDAGALRAHHHHQHPTVVAFMKTTAPSAATTPSPAFVALAATSNARVEGGVGVGGGTSSLRRRGSASALLESAAAAVEACYAELRAAIQSDDDHAVNASDDSDDGAFVRGSTDRNEARSQGAVLEDRDVPSDSATPPRGALISPPPAPPVHSPGRRPRRGSARLNNPARGRQNAATSPLPSGAAARSSSAAHPEASGRHRRSGHSSPSPRTVTASVVSAALRDLRSDGPTTHHAAVTGHPPPAREVAATVLPRRRLLPWREAAVRIQRWFRRAMLRRRLERRDGPGISSPGQNNRATASDDDLRAENEDTAAAAAAAHSDPATSSTLIMGSLDAETRHALVSGIRRFQFRFRMRRLRQQVHERDRQEAAAVVQQAWRRAYTRTQHVRALRAGIADAAARTIQRAYRQRSNNNTGREGNDEPPQVPPSASNMTGLPTPWHRQTTSPSSLPTTNGSTRLPECVVCLGAEVQVALLPCGHAQLCAACGAVLRRCPSCRALVAMKVRIYL